MSRAGLRSGGSVEFDRDRPAASGGADVSAFVPFSIYLQAMLADAAAPKHLTLSNLLALHIGG